MVGIKSSNKHAHIVTKCTTKCILGQTLTNKKHPLNNTSTIEK